jgi:hypothetical protein
MKSRRLIASAEAYEHWFKLAQSRGCGGIQTQVGEWPTDVRFGLAEMSKLNSLRCQRITYRLFEQQKLFRKVSNAERGR